MLTQSLSKAERLKSKKLIDSLFQKGRSIYNPPYKIRYRIIEALDAPIKFSISVPKKNIKKAVDRNLVKRRIKESYRIHKSNLHKQFDGSGYSLIFMFVYLEKQILSYESLDKSMQHALLKLEEKKKN